MPKKFKGENSKAVEARARKTAKKEEEDEQKQRQLEDEYWKDDDKHVLKKQQRKVLLARVPQRKYSYSPYKMFLFAIQSI